MAFSSFHLRKFLPGLPLLQTVCAALLLACSLPACSLFRSYGTKQQLDAPPDARKPPKDTRTKRILLEVTTDAESNITAIEFKQSSGSDAVDAYVAETLHNSRDFKPSSKSLVELIFSPAGEKRFSTPKLLSSTPLP